jgi:hypothetical protein
MSRSEHSLEQVHARRTSGASAAAEPTTSDDQAIARVVDETRLAELELVRFLYVDHGGIVRGKATSAGRWPTG